MSGGLIDRALSGLAEDGRRARIARKLPPEERAALLKRYGLGQTPATQAPPASGAPASPPTGVTPDGNR